MRIINKVLRKLYSLSCKKQENQNWYNDFSHFLKYSKPVLSNVEKKKAKSFFKKYGFDIRTEWHDYYTYMTGVYDERYIPADLMYTVIVPYLNYMPFESAYQDKGIYGRLLTNVKQPKTIIQRIHGFYYANDSNDPITEVEAIQRCSDISNAIIKPTIDTCQGHGVKLFSTKGGVVNDGVDLRDMFSQYGENFIVQERVRQHEFLSSLNQSSLNTMRVLTLRIGNEIVVLSKAIRVGGAGSITDNGYGGGFCTGIKDDGSLKPQGYQLTTGLKIDRLQNGVSLEGLKIPFFDKVVSKAKELAMTLPYLRIIGWDFAIDEVGDPVFIEMNTLPGIYIMQLCNGPVFGEYTEQLFESCSSVKYVFNYKMINQYANRDF